VNDAPVLIIRVEVRGVDPARQDPEDLAIYCLDPDADDPVPFLVSAEWA
jgi:hypothetical protein